jgi:hypothetical protein
MSNFFSSLRKLKALQLSSSSFLSSRQLSDILSATTQLEHLGFCFVYSRSTVFSTFTARIRNLVGTTIIPSASNPSRRVSSRLRNLNIVAGGFLKEIIGCLQLGDDVAPIDTVQLLITDNNDTITTRSGCFVVRGPRDRFGLSSGPASLKGVFLLSTQF